MSAETTGPRCPRCRRLIAAWRLAHCVYCGEPFPPDLKEGHAEPEALKWVERPSIPSDAAKQLELMKFFPGEVWKAPRSRPILIGIGAVSLVTFAVVFVLLYLLLRRSAPALGAFVLVLGAGFLAYLGWVFLRAYRRGSL
jgi:hypothetical protein